MQIYNYWFWHRKDELEMDYTSTLGQVTPNKEYQAQLKWEK